MARTFQFDGKKIPCEEQDTIASALHRAGVLTISRSMKYHRPRGLYCNSGSCAQCFVDVDGTPNVPACMRAAESGAKVTSQNRVGSAKRDLLAVVDQVYPEGFEPHQAFTQPGIVNRLFVRAVRMMSGWGKAPKLGTDTDSTPRRHTRHVAEIIIGAGRHGLERAKTAAGEGAGILLIDEMPVLGGSAAWDPSETETRILAEAAPIWDGVEIWTDALAFGIYGPTVGIRRGKDLWEITADRITIAPGQHDGVPVFEGNDRPGILSARGARRLWYAQGVLPGRRILVHGTPLAPAFQADLEAAGANIVATGVVREASGAPVNKAKIGDAWHRCDTILCNIPGVPRVELFQQAGCELTFTDALRPATGEAGQTSRPDVAALIGGSQ